MDLDTLDRRISDLTSALGDPTRRAIYIAIRESGEPLTATAIAQLFEIHPNVARHHLEILVDEGFIRVSDRRPKGQTAGRPAKAYEATAKEVSVHFVPRRFELLTELLLKLLEALGPEDLPRLAEKVGREYGKKLAAEIGTIDDPNYEEAVQAVARAMTGLGFHINPDIEGRQLVTSHCPFGDTAVDHPEVICSLDRGLVSGLLGALSYNVVPVVIPRREPEEECVTQVPVTISSR
ncbi:MAG TPA: helix-turn-helix domain-containing protein [Acidimicrobiia bacterium]